jgi:uncharacterized membrane protein
MVIMALDHVRDFFHADALQFQPDDLSRTTVALFLTRWITHFCAPVFMFTAGTSAYLWRGQRHSNSELSSYLWKRGLWLVVLELTVLRAALTFHPWSGPVLLTVLWALGWSMVALGLLSRIPVRAVAVLSIGIIAFHNLADPLSFDNPFWKILHQRGGFALGGLTVVVGYPLIPWIAVMAAGFSFGEVLTMNEEARQKWLVRLGLGLSLGFVVLRMVNIYGDPQRWSAQSSPAFTVLSFLKCTKYPPSLDFLLMTLGPALLLLGWFYRLSLPASHPLVVIGRVPLFYFLVHMWAAHLLTIPFALIHSGGYSLGTVYIVWVIVVGLMYPLCVWFAKLKSRSRSWWLAYL